MQGGLLPFPLLPVEVFKRSQFFTLVSRLRGLVYGDGKAAVAIAVGMRCLHYDAHRIDNFQYASLSKSTHAAG